MDLHIFWFLTLGFLLTGYAILDGFDLGVGTLHFFAKDDRERRILLNSIGPLWDGNEVWLVTFGGALFAAFPHAYATVFSAYYLPFFLLLFALILRAVSIEFRSKHESQMWRKSWDFLFFLGSTLAAFLFGVAVGNSIGGIPIGPDMEFKGTLFDLLRPYPVLVGFFTVSLFTMHGALFLFLKTEGKLQQRIYNWMWTSFGIFLVFYILTTIFTLALNPQAIRHFSSSPLMWSVVVLNVLAIANIPRAIFLNRPKYAFFTSCCTIAALNFLFGVALFPNIAVSSLDSAWNLTIFNAASSLKTLRIMQIVAMLGLPFVICYTAIVYWIFRGKVEIGGHSY